MRFFKSILACFFLFTSTFLAASDVPRPQNTPQGTIVKNIRVGDRKARNSGAIAPFVSWNTFLGGAKYDYPSGIAVDPAGNIYVAGDSQVSWGSPIQPFAGDHEAFVAKLNADGDLLWNTFLGGTGFDMGNALAVDSGGNIYIAGESTAAWGSPLHSFSGFYDAFVAKLDTNGRLQWNTFIGGAGSDEGSGLALGPGGDIFVTGSSDAAWGTPIRGYAGGSDAFVLKLSDDGAMRWQTFLGSADSDPSRSGDQGAGIAVDPNGRIYVTGTSAATWGTPIRGFGGGLSDPFIAGLDADGNLEWNTFLGEGLDEKGKAIAVDPAGNVYAAGGNLASRGSATISPSPDHRAFIAKLNTDGGLLWNTFLNGATYYYASGLALDPGGNIYIVGTNSATWLGTSAAPFAVAFAAFAAKLNAAGTLQWNISLGGEDHDYGWAVTVDPRGSVYATGSSCATWGSPIRAHTQNADPFVAVIKEGYDLTVASGPHGTTNPAPGTYLYSSGNSASVSAVADAGYTFDKWTGDVPGGQETSASVSIPMDAKKSIRANFKSAYTLTISSGSLGTTNPAPGSYAFDAGKTVSVTAIPDADYIFDGWLGDVPAGQRTSATVSILMNADKSIQAIFGSINPPSDLIAVRLTNRSLTQIEYIVDLAWAENQANAGLSVAGYRIYQFSGETWVKLADLSPDELSYRVRHVPNAEQIFGVATVTGNGAESAIAEVRK